jgi:FixJ family two-component response regulator
MKPRVLVVDDEPNVLTMCQRVLEAQGCTVLTTTSAEQALRMVASEPFDLLATDIRMPGMSGLDLMDRVAGLGLDLPVMVITGLGDLDMSVQALRAGAIDFITKPFGRVELGQAVARALLQARLARERARLRVLAPVLDLAHQVSQGAGLTTLCQAIVDLACGQAGARGAAILLEEPGRGDVFVAAARGMLDDLSAADAEVVPVTLAGSLALRATIDLGDGRLRDRLLTRGVRTIVLASLDAAGQRYGELWLALNQPPDRVDPHYAEAVTLLARHAANLLATARTASSVPVPSPYTGMTA